MKTLFIEAKAREKIKFPEKYLSRLPLRIGLVATVQYVNKLKELKKNLKKKVFIAKGRYAPGQILGCDVSAAKKIKNKVDAFLYIGSGRFHPLFVALKTKKDVFCFNPETKIFSKADKKEIEKIEKKQKGALIKFLSSREIGVLVSTKPGQQNLKKAVKLKRKFPDKNFYIFIMNTIDFNQLENFNFIECFVNTACPTLILDSRKAIVNVDEINTTK